MKRSNNKFKERSEKNLQLKFRVKFRGKGMKPSQWGDPVNRGPVNWGMIVQPCVFPCCSSHDIYHMFYWFISCYVSCSKITKSWLATRLSRIQKLSLRFMDWLCQSNQELPYSFLQLPYVLQFTQPEWTATEYALLPKLMCAHFCHHLNSTLGLTIRVGQALEQA